MGARRRLWKAVAFAAILCAATRSGASTVVEPIARLSLEGGWDSNVMYDGSGGDRVARVSPEVGLRLRDHLWDLRGSYGGDWLYYERLSTEGTWNHRASLSLAARSSRRTTFEGRLRGAWALDPVGLAQAGVFRAGRQSALILGGRVRLDHRATERLDVAATFSEHTVRFQDRTGGAMHAPGIEALWRLDPRLSVGGSYHVGLFQELDPGRTRFAHSQGARARLRWRGTRHLTLEAGAGPALWIGPDATAVVPEASAEMTIVLREWGLRVSGGHGLGIGTTARPGLVNSLEAGVERRFQHRWILHADGGLWHSGVAPSGADAVLGYVAAGEAGVMLSDEVRLSVVASHYSRLDDPSAALRRSIVGLRLGWELPLR